MTDYKFVLNFNLPHGEDDPEHYLSALYETGCDDALVGVGQRGMIGLEFNRSASSAEEALRSAISDVQRAIPEANLGQVGPDLVGLTEMAEIFSFSRQNMRKYAVGQTRSHAAFPAPTVVGELSLWHLAEIVSWLKMNTSVDTPPTLLEISKATAVINFELEENRLRKISGTRLTDAGRQACMALYFVTEEPKQLLTAFNNFIKGERLKAWSIDKEGDFTHTASQWEGRAWLTPVIESGQLAIYIINPLNEKISAAVYGIYHARFIESMLIYCDDLFSSVAASALPQGRDSVD